MEMAVRREPSRPSPGPATAATAVRLDGVKVSFAVRGELVFDAVAPTSFEVREGEFVSIVGPTGCGKSTLLNVTAGLLRPSAGHVEIFGERLAG